jgi:Rhodopirellula transposase DDE domain
VEQKLADEFDIRIQIHRLPPGTSKWNKVGHRLLSFITQNTRAKPSAGYRATSIDRPDNRTNRLEGLMQSRHQLSQGGLVSRMASINIRRAISHGEWNYTIAHSAQFYKALVSRRARSKREAREIAQ